MQRRWPGHIVQMLRGYFQVFKSKSPSPGVVRGMQISVSADGWHSMHHARHRVLHKQGVGLRLPTRPRHVRIVRKRRHCRIASPHARHRRPRLFEASGRVLWGLAACPGDCLGSRTLYSGRKPPRRRSFGSHARRFSFR